MKKITCAVKESLAIEFQGRTETYAAAVAELSRNAAKAPSDDYDELTVAAEKMRRLSAKARENYEGHIAEHGC
jgi:hypothetical protein